MFREEFTFVTPRTIEQVCVVREHTFKYPSSEGLDSQAPHAIDLGPVASCSFASLEGGLGTESYDLASLIASFSSSKPSDLAS